MGNTGPNKKRRVQGFRQAGEISSLQASVNATKDRLEDCGGGGRIVCSCKACGGQRRWVAERRVWRYSGGRFQRSKVWLQHRVIELEQDIQNLVACAVVEPGNLFTCEEQQGVAGLLQNGVPFV